MIQEYFIYTRKEILPLIPDVVSKVLDIGCGAGNTLAWIKSLRNCVWVGGVELSSDAAMQARQKLDEVYVGNIEIMDLPIAKGSLDLILCLDVLEHLVDPWSTVFRLQELLKPGGALIASIPNIRYYAVLFPLLFSQKWEYRDEGILDRTHLRFFVKETALQLITSSGLLIDMIFVTGLGKSRKSQIVNSMIPSVFRSLFEKQYLIRGVKPPITASQKKG